MPTLPLKIHIFDVGQGSSILIEAPGVSGQSEYGVIDCFTQMKEVEPKVLSHLKAVGAQKLKFVIITHPDKDHFFGLGALLRYFTSDGRSVELFIEGPNTLAEKVFNLLKPEHFFPRFTEEILELKKIASCFSAIRQYKSCENYQGKVCSLIPEIDFQMKLLYPTSDVCDKLKQKTAARFGEGLGGESSQKRVDFNLTCLVFSVNYGGAKFLITGDVRDSAWKSFYGTTDLKSDMATVVHHGGTGNPVKLWKSIAYEGPHKTVAVLSCGGANRHGHPDAHTLNHILDSKCALFCTEKGNPCINLENPADKTLSNIVKTVTDKFVGAVSKLGGKPCVCSGDMLFELYPSGEIRLIKRESDAECLYAIAHKFDNQYSGTFGKVGSLMPGRTQQAGKNSV